MEENPHVCASNNLYKNKNKYGTDDEQERNYKSVCILCGSCGAFFTTKTLRHKEMVAFINFIINWSHPRKI